MPQAPERAAAAVLCRVQQSAESINNNQINLTEMIANHATITDEDSDVSVEIPHINFYFVQAFQ